MKKQFGVPLLVLLVLFSHLTAVETKRKETTATSHKHKWMDMMQATQSQQCHTLQPENRDTEDKLVLAPIVFQGMYEKNHSELLHKNNFLRVKIKKRKSLITYSHPFYARFHSLHKPTDQRQKRVKIYHQEIPLFGFHA